MNSYDLTAWIQVLTRWAHVFAAMLWIGQTYLFNRFERSLQPPPAASLEPTGSGSAPTEDESSAVPEPTPDGTEGLIWMVHGGGFWLAQKHAPSATAPTQLHWFKWEAAATWISGFVLLILTYYLGGLLVPPNGNARLAGAIGLGLLPIGWLVYDVLVATPLARRPVAFAAVGFVLLLATHYGLRQILSSRASFFLVGALLGTIMAANVWLKILPAQGRLIAHAQRGETPSAALLAAGPLRSKHNTFIVQPLLFIMVSNHYPTISYGHPNSTVVLGAILLLGWGVAKVLRN